MADDDDKFPEFKPAILINPVLKQQNKNPETQWGYIQSASRELVAFLRALKCAKCARAHPEYSVQTRFTASNPPYILICGHYVHYNCRLVQENKLQQFKCRNCKYRNRFKGELWNDAVFKGFYEAIGKKGYPCIGCPEFNYLSAFHPKNNVVRVLGDNKHEQDGLENYRTKATYLCVWCAINPKYSSYYVRLLEPVDEQEADFSKGDLHQLNSVDCTLHCSQFPNVQCCHCIRPVIAAARESDRGSNYQPPSRKGAEHVPCGHIRCKGCKEKGVEQVYCNLCDEHNEWPNQDIEGTVSHFSKDVTSRRYKIYEESEKEISYDMFQCFKCKAYHPRSNMGSNLNSFEPKCVWCKVQGTLKNRRNEWEEEENKRRRREQEKGQRGRSKSLPKSEDQERGRRQEKGQEGRSRSRSKNFSKKLFGSKKKSPDDKGHLLEDNDD